MLQGGEATWSAGAAGRQTGAGQLFWNGII